MSQVCEICSNGPSAGQQRSYSKRATKRWFHLNLIKKKLFDPISKSFVRTRMCTRCNRTLLKQQTAKIEKAMKGE